MHLVYAESPDGPGEAYHIRYSRLKSGAPRFESPRALPGSRSGSVASEHYPQLSVDRAGSVYFMWERYLERNARPRGLAFAYSPDKGDHFEAPSVMSEISAPSLGDNGSQQGLFTKKLAVSSAGVIAIVNEHVPARWSESHLALARSARARWVVRAVTAERTQLSSPPSRIRRGASLVPRGGSPAFESRGFDKQRHWRFDHAIDFGVRSYPGPRRFFVTSGKLGAQTDLPGGVALRQGDAALEEGSRSQRGRPHRRCQPQLLRLQGRSGNRAVR